MCPIVGHLQEVAAGGERNIIPISTDPIEFAFDFFDAKTNANPDGNK